ncbi:poliovirus receptor isoform X2 [Nannospalax galili]|uniref:poliovirus receptor isoform X2 n=1 Tax=Nannospalax galili TaxID=1026970 RepID=UPI00111C565B|nr:poliovirus receptor isoform X2 [Nannospalax galili]
MACRALPGPTCLLLLVLLVLLVLLLSCEPCEAETVAVRAATKVTGFLGHSVTLLCSLQSEEQVTVTQVTWMKKSDESSHTVAVFHSTKGPYFPEPGRLQFVATKPGEALLNASLAISDLRAEDEGNYTCQFATFPMGSESAQVWLRVLARPRNTAEALVVAPEALVDAPTQDSVHVAKCVSSGGLPPAQITWRTDLNGTTQHSWKPGPQPGTFTVTSFFSLVPSSQADGKNLTCSVKHESFPQPDLQSVTLSLPYAPEVSISGYDDNWYLGRTDVALICDVRSNPEPTDYDWSTITGALPLNAKPQGNKLCISEVDSSTNTTFICHVTNAVGSNEGEVTIRVTESPKSAESGTELSSTVFIAIVAIVVVLGILLVLVVPLGVFLYRRRRKSIRHRGGQQQPQPSENRAVLYLPVENQSAP